MNQKAKDAGRRNVLWMGLASFFNDVSSEMILPVLPLFLTTVLGAGTALIGVIEGIAEATSNILKVVSGWMSDRMQRRKGLVISGYGLSTVVKPMLALATRSSHVLAVRFLDRVGKGIRTSPRDALIAASTTKAVRGKYFGIHRMLDTLGAVVGASIAMLLLWKTTNFRLIFWLAFIPAVVSVVIIWLFVKDYTKAKHKMQDIKTGWKSVSREFKMFMLVSALFAAGNFSYAFLIIRAQSIGVAIALIPLLYIFYNIIYSAMNMPAGALSDRIGRRNVMAIGYALFFLLCAVLAYADGILYALAAFVIYGVFMAIYETVSRAYVSDLAQKENRGTAIGLYNMVIGFAALPASIIVGWLWQAVSVHAAFFYSATTSLAAFMLIFAVIRK